MVLIEEMEHAVVGNIRKQANALSLSAIRDMLEDHSEISEYASHSLVTTMCSPQPHPGENGYYSSDTLHRSISSPVVWDALVNRHDKLLYSEIGLMSSLFGEYQRLLRRRCDQWRDIFMLASLGGVPSLSSE